MMYVGILTIYMEPIYKPSGGVQLNSQDFGYYFIVLLGNSQLE